MVPLHRYPWQFWLKGVCPFAESLRWDVTEPSPLSPDPPPLTPFAVVYDGGKVRLRHYRAVGESRATSLLLIYALLKRPFILDLQPGRSVVESLTRQGFEVYLTDWVPPTRADTWRGFDAYVNEDLVNAVRVVQHRAKTAQVSLLGYSFGGLLATIYTALHPATVKNLITLALPLDLSVGMLPSYRLGYRLNSQLLDLILAPYGNCPAWLVKAALTLMVPTRLFLPLYLRQDLCEPELATAAFPSLASILHPSAPGAGPDLDKDRQGTKELLALLERWLNSDVPLAGQIFHETMVEIFDKNLLLHGRFQVGGQTINLHHITCPVLNIIGEHDQVVPPEAGVPLIEVISSGDKQNLRFPTGHIGAAVSRVAHQRLWPQVGTWLKAHGEQEPRYRRSTKTKSADYVR
jgi:polyhydroxyalkanoate synthase